MVYEEFSVAMVGLVHESACGVTLGLPLEPFTLLVLRLKARLLRSYNDRRDLADGKAALLTRLLALGRDDLRIGGDEFYAFAIHNKETQVQSDLGGRKSDALGVVHRIKHIRAKSCKLFVKDRDRLTDKPKDGFGVFRDLPDRHRYLGITPERESRRKSRFALKPFSSRLRHSQQTIRDSFVGDKNVL